MNHRLFVLLLAVGIGTGQSFLNMHGLGELLSPGDARTAGYGSPAALSIANPGGNVTLDRTALNFSLLGLATIGSERDLTRLLYNVRPAHVSIAVPLPTRTRMLLGADSRFSQDFDVWSDSILDTLNRYHVVSTGGIYSLRAGIAQSLLNHFCVGIEYHRLLGGSREDWTFITGSGAYRSTDTIEIDYSGNSLRTGLSFQTRWLTLGLIYEPSLALTADRHRRVHGVVRDSVRRYHIGLPQSLSIAASSSPIEKLRVVAGADFRPWSSATIDDTLLNYRDVWRLSGGIEYELFKGYPIRAGYSTGDWYCQGSMLYIMAGNPISEQTLSLGTGVPIPRFGALDISAEVSLRSSRTNAGPIKETAGRLMLTLAYRELWQRRTRRWGY